MKYLLLSIITAFIGLSDVFAQPSLNFDLKKPKKFENKRLGSEKTGETKFTVPRRFIQNTVTHYNYYYNANVKLNELLERAKASFKDDYTKLLPFYNYDLKTTSAFRQDLDSIIYKSTAGILLHDLRNSWIDNLYLILGKAYYLRNELDSAYLTFQYVNYAFSPKEKDGWDKVIGSNQNEGGNAFSISTKENKSIVHRALTQPPSRNESFIWQIRTYLAKDELAEAAGLIETLRNDPLFPGRLNADLEEVQALCFYKQNMYDSAAIHLEKALGNAETKQEQARWEYLIAQLYERAGKRQEAKTFYTRATQHTINPLLEVYSILNALRQDGNGNEKNVHNAVEELVKMARKDKYFAYRDIVYYTAAKIEEEHNNPDAAKNLLLKSIKFSMNNPEQKSTSYLTLGDISFRQQNYVEAKQFYDSVNASIIAPDSLAAFNARKAALDQIATHSLTVLRQDSLQRIAAMPEAEREAFVKKMVKQLRRQQGLKEDGQQAGSGSSVGLAGNNKGPVDLFGTSPKGEWYFSNANIKTKGYSEFKSKWGDRPNIDNWRRSSVLNQQFAINQNAAGNNAATDASANAPLEITYDALLARLPLTPEQQKISLDSTEHALFALGKAFQEGLEEYPSAINAYERLLSAFPNSVHAEEAWFNLYYCYGKIGKPGSQQQIKQILSTRFRDGNFNAILNNPSGAISPDSLQKKEATAAYNDIYNLFIEGSFAEAIEKKNAADAKFGKNYWTPQLLYIEAIYHIKQRNDSTASNVLKNIIQLYPSNPLSSKSENILAVLKRRKEIEEYLTNLNIQRPDEEKSIQEDLIVNTPVKDSTENIVAATPLKDTAMNDIITPLKDSVKNEIIAAIPEKDTLSTASVQPEKEITSATVKAGKEPVRNNSETRINVPGRPGIDTTTLIRKPVTVIESYTNRPEQPHYVVFMMNKVDPVYVSEARNAFNRYNRENYYNKSIASTPLSLTDDVKVILFNSFDNAVAAMEYIDKAKKLAATEIIPWLKADKYSFFMITEENLELLKNRKDFDVYRRFLTESYPGKEF